MKTLYLECNMGAAGDMLMAALLELHENPDDFIFRLNNIGLKNTVITKEKASKCGIVGTHIKVLIDNKEEHEHEHHHHHHHNTLHNIEHTIGHLNISDNIKQNAISVYKLIAEAESHSHGVPVNQIHFHEVGELDAIADIVGVCMLIDELSPDKIISSPINVGKGHVHCSHGILPVPAPATAFILKGIPIYNDEIQGELCTPTGAALIKHFVQTFESMPLIKITNIGYGMGTKDFKRANCVRAFLGNIDGKKEKIIELICNLDDMTPEAVAFAQILLLDEGALDVYVTPIVMKKNRSGVMFSCLCSEEDKDKMVKLMFKHTTTLGIREICFNRYALDRELTYVETKHGKIRVKKATGFGVEKTKPEFEDIARLVKIHNP